MTAAKPTTLFFLVESNEVLLNAFIDYNNGRRKTEQANKEIADKLGAQHGRVDQVTGRLTGVVLPKGAIVPGQRDFKKADKHGVSYPKHGSDWDKIFSNIPAAPNASVSIANLLGLPLLLSYTTERGDRGHTSIGNTLHECGWLHSGGQLGFWVPNVPAYVEALTNQGYTVTTEGAADVVMEFAGCKPIHQAEWDLIVATERVRQVKESEVADAAA